MRVLRSLFVLLCPLFVSCSGSRVSHRVHILQKGDPCPVDARVRRGDEVHLLVTASMVAGGKAHYSHDAAEQVHVVGKIPVPVLNKAVLGMCPQEQRKVSLFWDGQPGMQYVVELKEIASAPRVKIASVA